MKQKIILICDICLSRNYRLPLSKKHVKRLELNKYCSLCKKTQLHKETR